MNSDSNYVEAAGTGDTSDSDVALRREIEHLKSELTERDAQLQKMRERQELELDQVRRELAQARAMQEDLAEKWHASRSSPALPVVSTRPRGAKWWPRLRGVLRALRKPSDAAWQRDRELLLQSDLFDADWYIAEYPDVANAGIEPAEHYLRFGAAEGRDPGPRFSTQDYLLDHPAVAGANSNPLIHFLRSSSGPATR